MSLSYKLPQSFFIFLFISFIAASLLAPLSSNSFTPFSLDLYNHIANIIQANDAMSEGQFPIRQALNPDNGYYYPNFQFYSPTSYTLAALIYHYLTPSNAYSALKITLWLFMTLGGIFMYRLCVWLLRSKPAALITSIIYLTSPYCLILINHLCGFNEALAIGIIPLVLFYSFKNYDNHSDVTHLLPLALSWYLLITTHLITFIYSASCIGFLFLMLTLKNKNHVKHFFRLSIGLGLGCLLAMWFLAPILTFSSYFNISGSFQNFSSFSLRLPPFLGLLSLQANYLNALPGSGENIIEISPAIGLPIVLGVLIGIYALFHEKKIINNRAYYWLPFLIITFTFAFLLTWGPLNIWKWLPESYRVGQYSWRMLSQIIWVGSLIAGCALCWIFKNKLTEKHVIAVTFMVVLATSSWVPITNKLFLPLDKFLKNPKITFNSESYLLTTQHKMPLVDEIHHYTLSNLMAGNSLILFKDYYLPRQLLNLASKPTLMLEGTIPASFEKDVVLEAVFNHRLRYKLPLKSGKFVWKLHLTQLDKLFANKENLSLQFQARSVKHAAKYFLNIPADNIYLSGFQQASQFLSVNEMKKFCVAKNNLTQCQLKVKSGIKLIELPVFYYPDLLQVKLNGRIIPYLSILESQHPLVAIKPIAGEINYISIQFVGSSYANLISQFALIICLLLCVLKLKQINIKRVSA